jgi:hypothetical protein
VTDDVLLGWHATHTNPNKHNMKYSLDILLFPADFTDVH